MLTASDNIKQFEFYHVTKQSAISNLTTGNQNSFQGGSCSFSKYNHPDRDRNEL